MLRLKNIQLTLARGSALEKTIFQNFNLEVERGEFLVVIGSNGAGKSSLFKLISGEIFGEGHIALDGIDISRQLDYQRAPKIAVMVQNPFQSTVENLTIAENLAFSLGRVHQRKITQMGVTKEQEELFKNELKKLGMGLENRLNQKVAGLSGGQRQALGLIMCTSTQSQLLLLDEHTAALDPQMSDRIMGITDELVRREKLTTLMVTHNMQHALKYGDRLILLHQGKVVKTFSKKEKENLGVGDLTELFNCL